ncbi:MAG: YHS domain protein [Verrucomicrobia bacterium]|nr:YHS domain protein [Verrucomicrobiota bacterium]
MIQQSHRLTRLLATALIGFGINAAMVSQAATKDYNLPGNKVALQGYDPVTYFTKKQAILGSASFKAEHEGVTYHFSSAETLSTFQAAPAQYLPTYGGWCATAMAKGEKVEIDPKNFKVTNGRLFLFFNAWYGDAKKTWLKDEAGQEKLADKNWNKISGE